MILSEAVKILEANGLNAEISNKRLRKMLDDTGYSDVHLIKGDGYFYVDADDEQHQDWLNALDSTSIYLNSFNQQSPEEWFHDIFIMLRKGRNAFIEQYPDEPDDVNEVFGFFKRKPKLSPLEKFIGEIKSILMKEYKLSKEDTDKAFIDASDKYWDYIELQSRSAEFLAKKIYEYWECWKGNSPCNFYEAMAKQPDDVNEDFGIGVGGMTGADQGIPMGGDCKAVVGKRMDGGTPISRFRKRIRKNRKHKQ